MKRILKNPLPIFGLLIVSFFLHNAVYGVFKIEEPIFFSLTLILALLFVISAVYASANSFFSSLNKRLRKK